MTVHDSSPTSHVTAHDSSPTSHVTVSITTCLAQLYWHSSLVPRPRPAFCRLQYGKAVFHSRAGRAWERGYWHSLQLLCGLLLKCMVKFACWQYHREDQKFFCSTSWGVVSQCLNVFTSSKAVHSHISSYGMVYIEDIYLHGLTSLYFTLQFSTMALLHSTLLYISVWYTTCMTMPLEYHSSRTFLSVLSQAALLLETRLTQ